MTHTWMLLVSLFAATAVAASSPSPYAGQESREIAALSATDVQSLLDGKGMGYAKVAELNGFPGPAHVLELADQLKLSEQQREQTQAIFQRMDSAAKRLGAQLVAAERGLDSDFHSRQITADSLQRSLTQVARLQGDLRGVHLKAHLEQAAVLDPMQVEMYVQLRGYSDGKSGHSGHH